jgi:hypothetical protein
MSIALPFVRCPGPLVDCPYAGNFGFDPLGLASSPERLAEYREAEIKHSRLAMLVSCVVGCLFLPPLPVVVACLTGMPPRQQRSRVPNLVLSSASCFLDNNAIALFVVTRRLRDGLSRNCGTARWPRCCRWTRCWTARTASLPC